MVKELIKIKPKELKQAQKIYKALELLGISQNDLLNITTYKQQIENLQIQVEELKNWKRIKIKEENERLASFKKNQKAEMENYMNDKGVEFDPYAQ